MNQPNIECDFCSEPFPSDYELQFHMNTKHSEYLGTSSIVDSSSKYPNDIQNSTEVDETEDHSKMDFPEVDIKTENEDYYEADNQNVDEGDLLPDEQYEKEFEEDYNEQYDTEYYENDAENVDNDGDDYTVHDTQIYPKYASGYQDMTPYGCVKPEIFPCDRCPKNFSKSNDLEMHKREHAPQGFLQFECRYCPTKFRYQDRKDAHERKHSKQKLHECRFCQKCFPTKHAMAKHEKTHTGEKPFKCKLCPAEYTQKVNLERHLVQRHDGEGVENTYRCTYCSKVFSVASGLKTHLRKHTGIVIKTIKR